MRTSAHILNNRLNLIRKHIKNHNQDQVKSQVASYCRLLTNTASSNTGSVRSQSRSQCASRMPCYNEWSKSHVKEVVWRLLLDLGSFSDRLLTISWFPSRFPCWAGCHPSLDATTKTELKVWERDYPRSSIGMQYQKSGWQPFLQRAGEKRYWRDQRR